MSSPCGQQWADALHVAYRLTSYRAIVEYESKRIKVHFYVHKLATFSCNIVLLLIIINYCYNMGIGGKYSRLFALDKLGQVNLIVVLQAKYYWISKRFSLFSRCSMNITTSPWDEWRCSSMEQNNDRISLFRSQTLLGTSHKITLRIKSIISWFDSKFMVTDWDIEAS
jgi:hypothetical protein